MRCTWKIEWLETLPGGTGYSIRKLRFEAAPGMWIPALLYQPDKLADKTPVVLNVNGHVGAPANRSITSRSAASTRPSGGCWR